MAKKQRNASKKWVETIKIFPKKKESKKHSMLVNDNESFL